MAFLSEIRRWSVRIADWIADWIAAIVRSRPYQTVVPFVTDVVRAFWVCRIAFISVAIGALVMWKAPQARDLFFETVSFEDRGQTINWFGTGDYNVYNKLLESFLFALVFCVAMLALWAIPLHGAARWSLDGLAQPPQTLLGRKTARLIKPRPPIDKRIVKCAPRIIGLATFAAIELGIIQALPEQFNESLVPIARDARYQLYILAVVTALGAGLFYVYTEKRYQILDGVVRRLTGRGVTLQHGDRVRMTGDRGVTLLQIISLICVTFLSVLFILTVFFPQAFYSSLISRALLVPIVLGTWVPLLSFATWLSYPLRVPLLTLFVVFIVVYQAIFEGHPVRPFPITSVTSPAAPAAEPASAIRPPLDIDKALQLWRDANECNDKCPRPIIVVAAGGASRAAYFAASTLGSFMDFSCDPAGKRLPDGKPQLLPCPTPGIPAFAKHIFAISAVSGGSLGAAVFSAALRTYQEYGNQADRPCHLPDGTKSDRFWFRSGAPQGWRDCMQVILAEDFLSPTIVGLAFRDLLPFLGFPDRAALLENAWVEAFHKFIPDKTGTGIWGMAATFDSLAPEKREAWRPLLVLNGTSVATGNRILTSHLAFYAHENSEACDKFKSSNKTESNGKSAACGELLFPDAFDFQEMFNVGKIDSDRRTVSVATAVTNSARFPLISPQGVLMKSRNEILDRIVDGGYFENYGITTAQDIAIAINKSDRKLNPLILLITNDPITAEDAQRLATGQLPPRLPENQNGHLLSWLSSPLLALYNTRSSRGDLATIRTGQFRQLWGDIIHLTVFEEPPDIKTVETGKCDRYIPKQVSMSWWLSKPVQQYLDNQFFDTAFSCGKEQEQLTDLCKALGDPLATRCVEALGNLARKATTEPLGLRQQMLELWEKISGATERGPANR